MSTMVASARKGWASFGRAWIVTRREVRDTMRDWRLMIPIGLLTLVFPLLMQVLANAAQRWALRWGGAIIGDRIIPFLLMIVGFFPISFSLVIALETFVGRKVEHRTDEGLPGRTDQERAAQWTKHIEACEDLQVVLERLAEPDTGIENKPLARDVRSDGYLHSFLQERPNLPRQVVVPGRSLHRLRRTLHMHQH